MLPSILREGNRKTMNLLVPESRGKGRLSEVAFFAVYRESRSMVVAYCAGEREIWF